MERNKKNSDIQLNISNLIDNAVNNAVARRNLVEDSEDTLLTLSDEEMAKVAGGLVLLEPIICGGLTPPILPDLI
ncbi:hypothetical protein [uncultured Nostoc sp.]|uniref:hypothetical protein n=1 Tax=uncultured Nostoc sp. TaxID=340711 RepID=UPI0035CC1F50